MFNLSKSLTTATIFMVFTSLTLQAQNTPIPRGAILDNAGNPIILSPVGGYLDEDTHTKGKKGLLKYYDEQLESGKNVATSIDAKLQKSTETILDEMKVELNATETLAMVMNSKTGELVTIATSNRYNPLYIRPKDVPSLNPKFTEYPYEPGAVMMPFTVAMSLNHELINNDKDKELINTDFDKFQIGENAWISDDVKHKTQTMSEVLVNSSNIGVVQIAWGMPASVFHYALSNYGFGEKSGIDLPRDLKGAIKSEAQLETKLYRANTAFGYGIMATPIQLLKAYSMFANDGWMITPHIAKKDVTEKKEVLAKPVAKKMKKMLIEVVKRGTAKKAQVAGLIVGGKTGTAHIARNGKYTDSYHSSFYGFAEDTLGHSYTIGVLVIDAKASKKYYASQSAVPTFRKIVEAMVKENLLTPSAEKIDIKTMQKQQSLLDTTNQKLNIVKKKQEVAIYSGDKTISPLKGAIVLKSFGKYVDPVYDIKIFNDNVILKSTTNPHNVYNVLDGKVVFAGKSSMLGKVIVMAHKDRLHTVYAGLDKIAPTIRVGTKIGQGYVIGKLKGKLIFQVTQDEKYVDPLSLIKLEEEK